MYLCSPFCAAPTLCHIWQFFFNCFLSAHRTLLALPDDISSRSTLRPSRAQTALKTSLTYSPSSQGARASRGEVNKRVKICVTRSCVVDDFFFFFCFTFCSFSGGSFFFREHKRALGAMCVACCVDRPFRCILQRRRRRVNKNYDEFNSAGPLMNSTASLSLRKLNIKEYKTARGAFVLAAVVAASETHTTHEKYVLLICVDPREQASKQESRRRTRENWHSKVHDIPFRLALVIASFFLLLLFNFSIESLFLCARSRDDGRGKSPRWAANRWNLIYFCVSRSLNK